MALDAESAHPPAGLHAALRKELASGNSKFLLDVEFAVPPGISILFGASGAGKTTTLECLAGLQMPSSGRVTLGERVLYDSARGINVPVERRAIGFVFQDLALFPHLTVEANVAYGLRRLARAECAERVGAILESFRIGELAGRRPEEISGGERQRAALARALVTEPGLLLLDEPLAALDAATKARIIDDLRAWNQARSIPVVYVTHSREEVFALGERVIVLERGHVLVQGRPQQVLEAPEHETVAQLAGFENIFDAEVVALHPERGSMDCRLGASAVRLEIPLARVAAGQAVRLGVRAGDILLAAEPPRALSARNILPGKILRLAERDFLVVAEVDCGVPFEVHLTPGGRESLGLAPGRPVWLVIKAHSCHTLRRESGKMA
jgi:molybdate transport system ATP-binding protein